MRLEKTLTSLSLYGKVQCHAVFEDYEILHGVLINVHYFANPKSLMKSDVMKTVLTLLNKESESFSTN